MTARLSAMPIAFWKSGVYREPVREFLQSLSKDERKSMGDDIRRLQFGWPVGMPLVRKLDDRLWELRSSLPSKREVRIIFTAVGVTLVLIHGFLKKSQKTPLKELTLAQQRLKGL
jgi:phage-related protein